MNLEKPRSLVAVTATALAILAMTVPAFAAKRRSAAHRPAAAIGGTISGVVLDSVTGQPVALMRVTASGRSDVTDSEGKFSIRNVVGYGAINVLTERSGYMPASVHLETDGDQSITIHVVPTATVALRTAEKTVQLDFDSINFGYGVPFSGYRQAEYDEFCGPDGNPVQLHRLQMKKITGPAVSGTSACCANPVEKITIQLKSGATGDYAFLDSCDGYHVELIGRDHVTGQMVYTPFTSVLEVTFP